MPVRIFELDGLRAVAICLVVLSHYFAQLSFQGKAAVAPLLRFGWSGVDLFFVLSGFLVASILLRQCHSPSFLVTFYWRRFWRLMPLYYTFILLSYLVMQWVGRHNTYWFMRPYLFHWQPYSFAFEKWRRYHFLSVTWSLGIEEYFYLVAPSVLVLLSRKNAARLCVVLLLALPIVRLWMASQPQWDRMSTIFRLDGLVVGVWIALAKFSGWKIRTAIVKPVWVVVAAIVFFCQWNPFQTDFGLVGLVGFFYSVVALFYGLTLLLVLSDEPLVRVRAVLRAPAVVYIGRISYGIYLLHLILYFSVTRHFNDYGVGISCLCLGVTFLLAAVSWEFFEKPLIEWSRRKTLPALIRNNSYATL